jgi:DNA polymerase III epsilon subunit-like protein/8-oxo-dGTP pyrophosphatase MutT (NUDIX family)
MTNWGRLAVFDLETTGVDVETSRIVSACVAVLEPDGSVVGRWDWLADPGVEIPEGASDVHGITTERAQTLGRPAADVVGEIAQTLRVLTELGMPLVVYNAPYDLSLLDRECRRHGRTPLDPPRLVIDPLVLDKAVDRYRKGKRTLEVTAERYGVSLDDAHDAGSDAIAAGRVAQSLARAYPEELDISAADLHGRQEIWFAEQAASFADYIRTTKGEETYSADESWPVRLSEHPTSIVDTQPIPAPAPRPSRTVPHLDFSTGVLELEGMPMALPALERGPTSAPESAPQLAPDAQAEAQVVVVEATDQPDDSTEPAPVYTPPLSGAYAAAPPPRRQTVLRIAAGIITDAAGRTLLVRKRGTAAFMQAGGKIEAGESALQALTRELREEVGLELDLDVTEYLGSFRAAAANEPDTVIRAEIFAMTTDRIVVPGSEIEQVLWLDTDEPVGIELAPLTRDTVLPLWVSRRSSLF